MMYKPHHFFCKKITLSLSSATNTMQCVLGCTLNPWIFTPLNFCLCCVTGGRGFPCVPQYIPYVPQYNPPIPAQPQPPYPGAVPFRQPMETSVARMPYPQQQTPMGYMNYNYQRHPSALNPYAEPFQGGSSPSMTPEDPVYSGVGAVPEGYNYRTGAIPPGHGQVSYSLQCTLFTGARGKRRGRCQCTVTSDTNFQHISYFSEDGVWSGRNRGKDGSYSPQS